MEAGRNMTVRECALDPENAGNRYLFSGFLHPLVLCVSAVKTVTKRRVLQTSETQSKYADNSFRNGEFCVPLESETRPERGRNACETGTAALGKTRWYTGTNATGKEEWSFDCRCL